MKKEFGFYAVDEEKVVLSLHSNHGKDEKKYLDSAKKMKRPILVTIESQLFETYKFKNFAMTVDEAKNLMRELSNMVEFLED